MKLGSIFILTNGVTADVPAADAALDEVIGHTVTMLQSPAFVNGLSPYLRTHWGNRIDRIVKRAYHNTMERCGNYYAPDLPAFTAPTFDNICEDPKVLFDRITAWAQNYLSGCRSGAAARIEERMQKWKIWLFRRAGCGYRWRTSDDRRNNGHFLAAGVYTIDNRCNPDFVDVNGNDCEQQALWCHTERWTTQYVFAPTGLHLLPLTGMKTEFGIQTAYSCPQCGCTGRINTDNSRKPGPALYPAP